VWPSWHSKCASCGCSRQGGQGWQCISGPIPSLVEAIQPAEKIAQDQPGDLLDNAIKQNVLLNVAKLKTTGPILSDAVQEGKLKIAGGVYSLDTGRVTLIG
jgi:carbonic anhydrase